MAHLTKIKLLDSTLREGEQSSGVCFSLEEKIEIAKHLESFGVDIIEVGHPGISQLEEEVCKKVCEQIKNMETLVHARACKTEILSAHNTGANWVGIWASFNPISLETKFTNKSKEWVKEQVLSSILFAKELGLKVRFTIEDASRTSFEIIEEIAQITNQAGVDRLSLADTVGAWNPQKCYQMVKFAVKNFNCEIEVHLHNDFGLALANAHSAIEAGASIIDVSVLGIGERAGICDLFQMSASLAYFYDDVSFNFKETKYLKDIVARISTFIPEPHRPIVGKNAFIHSSKYHAKANSKNYKAYEFLSPELFGYERKLLPQEYVRESKLRFSNEFKVGNPFVKSAAELKYHRHGVGDRWVHIDSRVDERSPVYIIERLFHEDYVGSYEPHVDTHAHNCDSIFVFMGNNVDGSGLNVKVTLGNETKIIKSPASVFIPAELTHNYEYISGTGRFLNFVMSPSYNKSLL
ncbi:homocitrate synthase/isopropylmalate synthase family protein [Fluviispira multicolorata]|uniref:2-isopropylmalate synthase n=1 Tax=Fluviispira multicolorata TaxID=2654512 RepID=A0A833N4I5_9BACT|nr:2-isopropylmalate synthase [Fluviispira multicolorata]KAB8028060.1 2-isopropylmalate synthase [Fluviispira multicolorata]